MASKLKTIREAMITALATITAGGAWSTPTASGTYTHTLTAAEQVRVGIVPDHLRPLPMIRILPEVRIVTQFGVNTSSQQTEAIFQFAAVVAVTGVTPDDGLDVAETLLEDIETCLRVNLHAGGADWFIVQNATLIGAVVEGVGEGGVVEGEIKVSFRVQR